VSLADSVRQITAGSFEGSPKWLTLNRNQDVLNFAGQQTSVNNPDLFNLECSVMPVIAYLPITRPRRSIACSRRRSVRRAARRQGPRSCCARAAAGIEAATNIVVRDANRTMLLYVYAAVILLCFIASAAGARWWSRWCRSPSRRSCAKR
jgi:hypothetical protein